MTDSSEVTILTTKFNILPNATNDFADWQAKLNMEIATFPGFISLEILCPNEISKKDWTIVQRFNSFEELSAWRNSNIRKRLMEEVKPLLSKNEKNSIIEIESGTIDNAKASVTEVFVTQVTPENENAYRKWMAKIHQEEAKFPGFRGTYVQAPSRGKNQNWITLLQFDSPENLDRWLLSSERTAILQESKDLIESLENHRVISPYAGWFASLAKEGKPPEVWKQSMVILLVLFPIVMLELKFLPFLTGSLNPSLATFISNAISVTLLAWPMLPIAIWLLHWWLSPKDENSKWITFKGTAILTLLYLIEIAIFWK